MDSQPITIPFEQLAVVGISKEAFESLPEDFRKKLGAGQITPLINTSVRIGDEAVVYIPAKLQLVRDEQGKAQLMAYPIRNDIPNDLQLSPYELDALKKGEVLLKGVDVDGVKVNRYLQLDPETKSIMFQDMDKVKLEQRLKDFESVADIQLGQQQKQQAREGRPLELEVGGEKVTVGVDLREPSMFKVFQGDMKEWDRQRQMKYDDAHPEFIGLVQTEKNRWEYKEFVSQQQTPKEEIKQSTTLKR